MVFQTKRRVEFRDTDAAGITHFSAFFPMMEAAEHEMLRSLGISVMPRTDDQDSPESVTWPRVAVNCQYRAAARFEDVLDILITVGKLGESSVTYQFRFEREGDLIAEGEITAVCCHLDRTHAGHSLQKVPIPAKIRNLLASL